MLNQVKNFSTRLSGWFFHHSDSWFFVFVFLMCLPGLLKAQEKPNVLFIISDDLNTRIGPYMNIDDHTPHLDRLAKEGVRFSRTYSQYPVCGPSRASLMSGLYPETNGILKNSTTLGSYKKVTPALTDHPSLAGFFREQGYYTARVSKIFHMGVPGGIERGAPGGDDPDSWDYAYNVMGPETLGPGNLELLSPKNNHYGGNFSRMIIPDSLEHTQTDLLAANQAIAILENRAGKIAEGATNLIREKPDSPFFLAVGFVRPHVPLIAPERSFQYYPEDEIVLPPGKVGKNVPDKALRQQNENKFGMNERQKRQINSAYMASVRFMDQQVESLARYLTTSESALQERNGEAYTVSYRGNAASIRTERWRYTRWGKKAVNGNEELYDHKRDPEEHVNLAGESSKKDVLEKMRKKLDAKKQKVRQI